MSLVEWAEREIKIACDRERSNSGNADECGYGIACYESALKAFKSLAEDRHSGFSIGITKHILNRLIDGRPLTPIEDTDDAWSDCRDYHLKDGYVNYQCKRMSSLFKNVYDDGTIKYSDVNRHYCVDIHDRDNRYYSGLVRRIIDEMFPITMPYMPTEPMKVYCEEFLIDRKNGDFDTVGILYLVKPDGERIDINKFFKEGENDWIEIDEIEYLEREASKL